MLRVICFTWQFRLVTAFFGHAHSTGVDLLSEDTRWLGKNIREIHKRVYGSDKSLYSQSYVEPQASQEGLQQQLAEAIAAESFSEADSLQAEIDAAAAEITLLGGSPSQVTCF